VDAMRREPILGAVGQLQFEVVTARLAQEYNVETHIEMLPYTVAGWVEASDENLKELRWSSQSLRTHDRYQNLVVLFESAWHARYTVQQSPTVQINSIAGSPLNLA
jgi:peptide chain release factor 3